MNRGKYSELVIVLVFLMVLLFSGYLLADDIPEGHVRLHYHRFDGEYLGWGLHIWGEGYNGSEVLWTKPVEISGFDDYGAYWDIPYKEGVGDLNFIIHKGDLKDPSQTEHIRILIQTEKPGLYLEMKGPTPAWKKP